MENCCNDPPGVVVRWLMNAWLYAILRITWQLFSLSAILTVFFWAFLCRIICGIVKQKVQEWSMLQNWIDLSTVDVSYVSSHSWYFLNLFGLRGLFQCRSCSELQHSHDAAIIFDALYATNSKEMEPTTTTSQVSNMVTSSQVSKHSSKSPFIQIGMNGQVTNILKEIILQRFTETAAVDTHSSLFFKS
ncbi:ER membrane complex subunit 3 [Trifolium repens]|nr:ER membrane complex subunit 3 [Trifolium repens]